MRVDMVSDYPDLEWYLSISASKGVSPRCPYASIYRCPRYYESLSLLGNAEMHTKIDQDKDTEVRAKWEQSEFWPVVLEHAAAISGAENKKTGFHNFCPEVSFQMFQLFASQLHQYTDELDKKVVYERLHRLYGAWSKDWRWDWRSVEPMHYTGCHLYSLLLRAGHDLGKKEGSVVEGAREDVLSMKPGVWGFSVNIKALLTRCSKWWLKKN